MATVYFVREGSGNERTSLGREIPLREIVKAFPNAKAIWSADAPTLNPERSVNPRSGFRYVVVHVEGAEAAGQITKDGYWLLDGVSPTKFAQIFPNAAANAGS